jgi:hypothetical protein
MRVALLARSAPFLSQACLPSNLSIDQKPTTTGALLSHVGMETLNQFVRLLNTTECWSASFIEVRAEDRGDYQPSTAVSTPNPAPSRFAGASSRPAIATTSTLATTRLIFFREPLNHTSH